MCEIYIYTIHANPGTIIIYPMCRGQVKRTCMSGEQNVFWRLALKTTTGTQTDIHRLTGTCLRIPIDDYVLRSICRLQNDMATTCNSTRNTRLADDAKQIRPRWCTDHPGACFTNRLVWQATRDKLTGEGSAASDKQRYIVARNILLDLSPVTFSTSVTKVGSKDG